MLEAAGPSSQVEGSDQRVLAGNYSLIKNPGSKGPYRLAQTSQSLAEQTFGKRGQVNIHVGNAPKDLTGCLCPGSSWQEVGLTRRNGVEDRSNAYPSVISSKTKLAELQREIAKYGNIRAGATYDGYAAYGSGYYCNVQVVILDRPTSYLIKIDLAPATGFTARGAPLAQFQVLQTRTSLSWFVDTTQDIYDNKQVPVTGGATYLASSGQPLAIEVTKSVFDNVTCVYLWAANHDASFWRVDTHDALAVGRIKIPASTARVVSLSDGSMMKLFQAGILQSPVQYITREMVTNSRSDLAKRFAERNISLISDTHLDWYNLTQEGNPWDYKPHVNKVWGDSYRLGNSARRIDSGGFSNFHFGYVSAAAGFSKFVVIVGSDVGQKLSNVARHPFWTALAATVAPGFLPLVVGGDPPEDRFAITEGYRYFTAHNGEGRTQHYWVGGPKTTFEVTELRAIVGDVTFEESRRFFISYCEQFGTYKTK